MVKYVTEVIIFIIVIFCLICLMLYLENPSFNEREKSIIFRTKLIISLQNNNTFEPTKEKISEIVNIYTIVDSSFKNINDKDKTIITTNIYNSYKQTEQIFNEDIYYNKIYFNIKWYKFFNKK